MKRFIVLLMLMAAVSPALSGCFGKFAITRKVYDLNASVHDRYLRNVVTWAFIIVPVYGVAGVIDFVLFNTIEFWSGRNPVTAGVKSFHYSSGDQLFNVMAVKSGETITFTIDRYQSGSYQDSLTIKSDLTERNSTATLRQPGKVTEYVAQGLANGVGSPLEMAMLSPRSPELGAL